MLVNPSFQYFVVPGLAIGADVLVNRRSQGDSSQTSLGIGPSASYFFGRPESNVYPFISASPLFSMLRFEVNDEESSANGFGGQFSGGAAFMLARNEALIGEAFYLIENLTPEEAENSVSGNTFGVAAFIF